MFSRTDSTTAPLDRSEDERALTAELLAQVRRFAAREVDSASIDRDARIPPSVIESAARLGLFAMAIPSEFGGAELGMRSVCAVIEELARHDRSVAIMVGLHAGLGTRAIIEFGDHALKERVLPAMASGELIGAFAATEPRAGSDLMSVQTTARIEGDGLALDGDKSYVTNGGFAGIFTVLARTPEIGGAKAHSLVCVERATPGVIVGGEEHKLGIRGSSTVGVSFDNARVSRGAVLGPGGRGMHEAHRALSWGRTVMAAGCVGTARAALDATLAFTAARRQFGKPIAEFGATQVHLARMASTLFAMRSLVHHVSEREDRGAPIEVESMHAKVFCSEGAFDLCDTAVQLHGALGFIEPVGVARLLRDCRITRIFEGANDVLLVRAGMASLSGHHRPRIQHARTIADVSLLAAAVDCERFGVELDTMIARVRKVHGVRVVSHQALLQRVARAVIDHAAAVAAIELALRSQRTQDIALAIEAVAQCVRRGRAALATVDHADEDEAMSRSLLELISDSNDRNDSNDLNDRQDEQRPWPMQ